VTAEIDVNKIMRMSCRLAVGVVAVLMATAIAAARARAAPAPAPPDSSSGDDGHAREFGPFMDLLDRHGVKNGPGVAPKPGTYRPVMDHWERTDCAPG